MNLARAFIVAGALLVLGAVNYSIFAKENIKSKGELVYLELAPRDPRSLMQGDYMALRFRLAADIQRSGKTLPMEGTFGVAEVALDDKRVAHLVTGPAPAGATKLQIRYRIRNGDVWLGTNAFFFEEGTGDRYARARLGEFRVDTATGEAVLVGLKD